MLRKKSNIIDWKDPSQLGGQEKKNDDACSQKEP
jgi:hypothetical protein